LKPPLNDRAVANAALRYGVDVQPVSINYLSDAPRQGLLLGFAGLGDREVVRAVNGLRSAFQDFDPQNASLSADPQIGSIE
jgi:GntR family transcriptional regulator/MocR family aminotransferase